MMSVSLFLVLAAFVTCIMAAIGRCPLWVPVLLLVVDRLLTLLPK